MRNDEQMKMGISMLRRMLRIEPFTRLLNIQKSTATSIFYISLSNSHASILKSETIWIAENNYINHILSTKFQSTSVMYDKNIDDYLSPKLTHNR